MKEKIEQFAKGNFTYELPKIIVTIETAELFVETGSTYSGSFTISNDQGSHMKGVLYSSSRLLRLEDDKFIGTLCQVGFQFEAKDQSAGEVLTEQIQVISDCGEATIDITIHIEAPCCVTTAGKINDLDQFVAFAKDNWNEAVQVFEQEQFLKLLHHKYKELQLPYNSLRKSSNKEQALEEFLVLIHGKQPVKLSVNKTKAEYTKEPYDFMDKIVITRDTFGFVKASISTDAPFIELDRDVIGTSDFTGDSFELKYVIKSEHMKPGIHCGTILIETASKQFNIDVTVRCIDAVMSKHQANVKEKKLWALLMLNYLKFRMEQCSEEEYTQEAHRLLRMFPKKRPENIREKLYQIHLMLAEQKQLAATNMLMELEKIQDLILETDMVAYGCFLYLKEVAFPSQEGAKQAREELKSIADKVPGEVLPEWCRLYLDPMMKEATQKKTAEIMRMFQEGKRSPILYYEVAALYLEDAALLKSLGTFECQVLFYCIRHGFLSKDLVLQTAYLAIREKNCRLSILHILRGMYDIMPLKELLQAICSYLIRGNQRSVRYHRYYEAGIEQQLRVAQLPEYYIYSRSESSFEAIHPSVLAYFNFNNYLPEKKKAYYYACLIKNSTPENPLWEQHREDICAFAKQQLMAGNTSEAIAILCDTVLTNDTIDQELAMVLPEICFEYMITVDHPAIRKIAIVQPELKEEQIVPVVNGQAQVSILSEHAQIYLIDSNGYRYFTTVGYSLRRLSHLQDFYETIYHRNPSSLGLILHLVGKANYYDKYDEAAIELLRKASLLPQVSEESKKEYIQTIVHYYYDSFEGEVLERYLDEIDLKILDPGKRIKMMEFMISQELYNTVLKAMAELGFEQVELKWLTKLCTNVIVLTPAIERIALLVDISYYVFIHQAANDKIAGYLAKYFNGTTKQMYELWKYCNEHMVECTDLKERLLAQILFTQEYVEESKAVFAHFYLGTYQRKLARAYLSYLSYRYLIWEEPVNETIAEAISKELKYEDNEIALAALLKFLSTKEQLSDQEINFIDYHLAYFEQKHMIFPFFQAFGKHMRIPQHLYDKTYIEYHANPKHKVSIRYSIHSEDGAGTAMTEEMKNIYQGIFVKECVLFEQEEITYEIIEETLSGTVMTEPVTRKGRTEEVMFEESSFERLNHIVEAASLKEETSVNQMLTAYAKIDHCIEKLFRPII